jgi:cytochrome c5
MIRTHPRIVTSLAIALMAAVSLVYAEAPAGKAPPKKDETTTAVVQITSAAEMRLQGEQRFRANCNRCHAAPQKFPPRMMKTVLRHMRVRATITDEDMRLVLFYMSQ